MAKVKKFVKIGERVTSISHFDLETASRFGRHSSPKNKASKDAQIMERTLWTVMFCSVFVVAILIFKLLISQK